MTDNSEIKKKKITVSWNQEDLELYCKRAGYDIKDFPVSIFKTDFVNAKKSQCFGGQCRRQVRLGRRQGYRFQTADAAAQHAAPRARGR